MAHEAQAHDHHEVATNTGIDNRKLGFWLFLSSECIFFASLIVGYIANRHRFTSGPGPTDVFNIPLTSISTFVLLMSSLAMVLAVFSAQQGMRKQSRNWLIGTAAMGTFFLLFQVYEFWHFVTAYNLTLKSSLFGTAFYTLTGFHGAHVLVGVIWLLSLIYHGGKEGPGQDKALDVEIGGLYWHFVDIVWIVIFTVVYLIEFVK